MEIQMDCPTCGYAMTQQAASPVYAQRKYYDWKKFECKRDDVWIELWTPKEEEAGEV